MLVASEHGGGCCGIRHLHEFPDSGECVDQAKFVQENLDAVVKAEQRPIGCTCSVCRATAITGGLAPLSIAVEVVLASYQLPDWREAVETAGFKEVFSFMNSNSDNRCHVFYLELQA